MIILDLFDELCEGMGFQKMKDAMQPNPYNGIDKIVKYLRNGKVKVVSQGRQFDVFTG